jgi:erythronate-4-phosphate dehydrogenase
VVDNAALRELLLDREDLQAVLDVWEGEPQVDLQLADLCTLATPHIAGYSLDGKQRGTAQIYQAFCRFLGNRAGQLADLLPAPGWRRSTWMLAPIRPGPWRPCAGRVRPAP